MAQSRIVYRRGPKGVVLRPLNRQTDMEFLIAGINNPEVNRFLGRVLPMTHEKEAQWFDRVQLSTDHYVLAIENPDGELIGTVGLHQIDWIHRYAGMGIGIFSTDQQDKGFGSEALLLMLQFAFNTLNLRRVESTVYAFNKRSIALHQKCGAIQEGVKRKRRYLNGRYHDEILYVITKPVWRTAWKQYRQAVT